MHIWKADENGYLNSSESAFKMCVTRLQLWKNVLNL